MFVRREDEYNLKESFESLGWLDFCLEDKFGNLVDGFHRRSINADWPAVRNPNIDSPLKLAVAQLVVNLHRRDMDFQEKREKLGRIMRISGWSPQETSHQLRMSLPWVYKYMPTDLLKRKVLHKRVDILRRRKPDRASESRALAELMKEIEGNPNPEVVGALQAVEGGPLLPFPDCKCTTCPHIKECRFLWG